MAILLNLVKLVTVAFQGIFEANPNATIARGQWLGDMHIDHVQALLSISHPAVDGLQSTCPFEPSGCQFQ